MLDLGRRFPEELREATSARSMPEILTESFCERCGTKYTLDAPEEKRRKGGGKRARVIARGLKNFVLSDDPLEDAFAAAEIEEGSAAASQQLEAFHELFNFCMECRQYTCANCWNQDEGRCLSCAPVVGRYDPLLSLTQDSTLPSLSAGLGMDSALQAAIDGRAGNGHTPVEATAWPSVDLPPTPETVPDAEIPDWLRVSDEEQAPQLAIEAGPADELVPPEALAPEAVTLEPEPAEAIAPEPVTLEPEPVEAIAPELEAEPVEAIAPEPVALEPEPVEAVALEPQPVEAIAPEPVADLVVPRSLEPFDLLEADATGLEPAAAEWPEPLPLGVSEVEMPLPQAEPTAPVAAEAEQAVPEFVAGPSAAAEPHAGLFDRIMDRFGFPHPTEATGAAAPEGIEAVQPFEAGPEDFAAEPAVEAEATVEYEPEPIEAEVVVAEDQPLALEAEAFEPEAIEAELAVDEDQPLALEAEPMEAEPLEAIEAEPFEAETVAPAPEPEPEAAPWPVAAEEAAEPEPVWPPRAPVYQPPPPAAMPTQPPATPMPSTVRPPAAPMVPPAMAAQQVQQARAAQPIEPVSASLVWEESTRGVVSRAGTSVQGCVSCGLALSASARFCRRCGTRQG